jgi:hypothetical protein
MDNSKLDELVANFTNLEYMNRPIYKKKDGIIYGRNNYDSLKTFFDLVLEENSSLYNRFSPDKWDFGFHGEKCSGEPRNSLRELREVDNLGRIVAYKNLDDAIKQAVANDDNTINEKGGHIYLMAIPKKGDSVNYNIERFDEKYMIKCLSSAKNKPKYSFNVGNLYVDKSIYDSILI